ncbi:uncharacterized protein LOC126329933 [Schistocerca gregaria]|uniref:uncharacterized protein LOC126329933 n=1 Tax=Schistocerca gregaria TaxID=7010 RepID=UPI00211E41FA|nr:uncharacterized protein LOC126329933 [Schistocerca gregaria]
MSIDIVIQRIRECCQQSDPSASECAQLLADLKIGLTRLQSTLHSNTQKNLELAREGYELATLLSVRLRDESAFEKYIALLRPYYFDYPLPSSPRRYLILGLYLLFLLIKSRIGDFHIALELLPCHSDPFIKFSLDLERDMTEGRYNKIWHARQTIPDPSYSFFVEMLTIAVCKDIAKCMECSYNSIGVQEAVNLLHFSSAQQLESFIRENGFNWVIENQRINFHPERESPILTLDAHQLIHQNLVYAHEIERII